MRQWVSCLAFGLVLGLGGAILAMSPAGFAIEERLGLSWLFQIRGPIEPPPQVAVIAIDTASAHTLDLPSHPRDWPRSLHGRLLDALGKRGATTVVFDLHFQRPQPPEEDQAFASALTKYRHGILFEAIEQQHWAGRPSDAFEAVRLHLLRQPLPMLADAAAGVAPFPLPKSSSDVIHFWAFFPELGNRPTLPVVALQTFALAVDPFGRALFERVADQFVAMTPMERADPLAYSKANEITAAIRDAFADPNRRQALWEEALRSAASASIPASTGASADAATIETLRRALIALYSGPNRYYLNFYGPPGTIRHIPYASLLSAPTAAGGTVESGDIGDLSNTVVFVAFPSSASRARRTGFPPSSPTITASI
ncbi:MAG: CHASE2 domain-containing protein [Rhodospirillales bacterium]|nr:CHASE2 domain-containing protein [Rhodospirillales bacterium]